MTKTYLFLAPLALMLAGAAGAQSAVDGLVASLQSQGYASVEVRNGPTQSKVEAVRGTEKVEIVIDRATGTVVKSETERLAASDLAQPGLSIRSRDRDFVRGDDADDDGDDDGDRRGRGRGSDDGSADDGDDSNGRNDGRGRGGDDRGGDDRGGDDRGGDDRGGDDD